MHRYEIPNHDDNEGKIRMYRRFANIDESIEITEDNIDECALQQTAVYVNEGFGKIRKILLQKD